MVELTIPKVVYVKWRDCSSVDAWMLPPEIAEYGCPMIHTCGFLVVDCPEFITVSVAWEDSFGKAAGSFNIPRGQIVSVEEVVWQ